MIQDYLKTSLVFYDDIEKQHRYNDCCQETTNYDGLISPTDRFLPFQIRIPTDEWVGDINTVSLLDDDDDFVANLIAAYGIRPLIELVSNCSWTDTYVWLIYSGAMLSAALPEGNHYIRITDDAGHAWYSEIFQICNMSSQVDSVFLESILVNPVEWTNGTPVYGSFDTFTEDGPNITSMINNVGVAPPGTASAHTVYATGYNGDRFAYSISLTHNTGVQQFTIFLSNAVGNILSNMVNLYNPGETILYEGVLTSNADGPYWLIIVVPDDAAVATNASAEVLLARIPAGAYAGCIGVEWYNDCDFDGIIYQTKSSWYTSFPGYANRLYFQKYLESPRTETTKDGDERLGTFHTKSIVQKKFYIFKVLVPEFLYNVLQTLQLYANNARSSVFIYLENGDYAEVSELNILEEWVDANCYCHLTIEFREDAVVWTNCCDNYALRDESSCV